MLAKISSHGREPAAGQIRRFQQVGQRFTAVLTPHLVEEVGPMDFHGAHADTQLIGDHLVEFPGEDQIHDLSFAGRQGPSQAFPNRHWRLRPAPA